MDDTFLLQQDFEAVRLITLNRPDALNALNVRLLSELHHSLQEANRSNTVRVVVMTGSGERAFAAGADVKELSELSPLDAQRLSHQGQSLMNFIEDMDIPVLAAVRGFAFGGGLELAMACDFIYASTDATLGLVEANLGLIPGFGGVSRLAHRIGEAAAREALYTARRFKAEEALQLGLVNRVLPADTLLQETMDAAKQIAAKNPASIRALKSLFESIRGCRRDTTTALEQNQFGLMFSDEMAREGIEAFIEKRKPKFQNEST